LFDIADRHQENRKCNSDSHFRKLHKYPRRAQIQMCKSNSWSPKDLSKFHSMSYNVNINCFHLNIDWKGKRDKYCSYLDCKLNSYFHMINIVKHFKWRLKQSILDMIQCNHCRREGGFFNRLYNHFHHKFSN
jgi:hypothetical protein